MTNRILLLFLLLPFLFALSCDGNGQQYENTTEALTRYSEIPMVDFSISGTANCATCRSSNLEVKTLQIEVVAKESPTTVLASETFDGLGSFSISNLRYRANLELTVYGTLIVGSSPIEMDSSIDIMVPENNGGVVSCILNFPPSISTDESEKNEVEE